MLKKRWGGNLEEDDRAGKTEVGQTQSLSPRKLSVWKEGTNFSEIKVTGNIMLAFLSKEIVLWTSRWGKGNF